MLIIASTTETITHKIVDESGKWVGNIVGNTGCWVATQMAPVVIDGKHHGQYRELGSSHEIARQSSALGWLQDREALFSIPLPA